MSPIYKIDNNSTYKFIIVLLIIINIFSMNTKYNARNITTSLLVSINRLGQVSSKTV